jgi:ubiquinone biosynthesis protein UbiJ
MSEEELVDLKAELEMPSYEEIEEMRQHIAKLEKRIETLEMNGDAPEPTERT